MPNGSGYSSIHTKSSAASTPVSRLKDGCYLIQYFPNEKVPGVLFYEGTVRALHLNENGDQKADGEIRASGDLYARLEDYQYGRDQNNWLAWAGCSDPNHGPLPTTLPDPGMGIPVFPRSEYSHHLQVVKLLEGVPDAKSATVRFQIYEFSRDDAWPNPGSRTVVLNRTARPADYPKAPKGGKDIFLTGVVLDEDSGAAVGVVRMSWLSDYLRSATIVINKLKGLKSPGGAKKSDLGKNWQKAFDPARWQIKVEEREFKVKVGTKSSPAGPRPLDEPSDEPSDKRWSIGELQSTLLQLISAPSSAVVDPSKEIPWLVEPSIELDPLDKEWRYQLICVPDIAGFDRGVMFDTYGSDSRNVPREGSAVAALWQFDDTEKEIDNTHPSIKVPLWGEAKDKKLEDVVDPKDAYFRVAVHEIGHAMGLGHNFKDDGFMNTTDSIAEDAVAAVGTAKHAADEAQAKAKDSKILQILKTLTEAAVAGSSPKSSIDFSKVREAAQDARSLVEAHNTGSGVHSSTSLSSTSVFEEKNDKFPEQIELSFHRDDLNRLRFGADVTVRPGTAFEDYGPLFADDAVPSTSGLQLEVSSLLDAVPLGAPVRIQMRLKNASDKDPVKAPQNLSLKHGTVSGRVSDPDGNERTFWPVKVCLEDDSTEELEPGASSMHSITLLRGAQKALFPMEGPHQVKIRAVWEQDGARVFLEDEATVQITPPADDAHRAAAFKVISTPDTLLSLAIGGEHLTEGNLAIDAAVDNTTLKPHFAVVKAKRLLTSKPPAMASKYPYKDDIANACALIDESTVLSFVEVERLMELLCAASVQNKTDLSDNAATVKQMIDLLVRKLARLFREQAVSADKARSIGTKLTDLEAKL